jgi:hypothetical protein
MLVYVFGDAVEAAEKERVVSRGSPAASAPDDISQCCIAGEDDGDSTRSRREAAIGKAK